MSAPLHASPWEPSDTAPGNMLRHPKRDYFFYQCVHTYFKGERLDKVDISPGYELDAISADEKTLNMLNAKAKRVAESIKARQHPGTQVVEGQWWKAAILATCLEESRALKLPGKEPQ